MSAQGLISDARTRARYTQLLQTRTEPHPPAALEPPADVKKGERIALQGSAGLLCLSYIVASPLAEALKDTGT